jgi:hypothetical protein
LTLVSEAPTGDDRSKLDARRNDFSGVGPEVKEQACESALCEVAAPFKDIDRYSRLWLELSGWTTDD